MVILDESESIIQQLNSNLSNKYHMNYKIFENLIR